MFCSIYFLYQAPYARLLKMYTYTRFINNMCLSSKLVTVDGLLFSVYYCCLCGRWRVNQYVTTCSKGTVGSVSCATQFCALNIGKKIQLPVWDDGNVHAYADMREHTHISLEWPYCPFYISRDITATFL